MNCYSRETEQFSQEPKSSEHFDVRVKLMRQLRLLRQCVRASDRHERLAYLRTRTRTRISLSPNFVDSLTDRLNQENRPC